ncbi:MAG TPA: hypothetical protein VFL74_04885 [Sphingomicrobium sp.]|nr:hypothetical protein [Sphingomicrobium sp.]
MRLIVVRLISLVAVLLMPLGMSPAPAAAAQLHHGASMPMQHCPEQGMKHQSKAAFAECTMACASALPAVDRAQEQAIAYAPPLVAAVPVLALDSLHPETATPPPKIA